MSLQGFIRLKVRHRFSRLQFDDTTEHKASSSHCAHWSCVSGRDKQAKGCLYWIWNHFRISKTVIFIREIRNAKFFNAKTLSKVILPYLGLSQSKVLSSLHFFSLVYNHTVIQQETVKPTCKVTSHNSFCVI